MSERVFIYEEAHPEPGEKVAGVIFPVGYENRCCEGKPFILYAKGESSFSCRCGCDKLRTTSFSDPIRPVMQYELMCKI